MFYEKTCALSINRHIVSGFLTASKPPVASAKPSVALMAPTWNALGAPSSAATTLPTATREGWLYRADGYTRAVELQKELNVPLVVYFYVDWCPYCKTLDNQYLQSAPVQDYLRGVVKVRINAEQGFAERALAKRFGVTGYPSFFVVLIPAARPVMVSPFRRVGNLTPTQLAKAYRAVAPFSQEVAVRSSAIAENFASGQGNCNDKDDH